MKFRIRLMGNLRMWDCAVLNGEIVFYGSYVRDKCDEERKVSAGVLLEPVLKESICCISEPLWMVTRGVQGHASMTFDIETGT